MGKWVFRRARRKALSDFSLIPRLESFARGGFLCAKQKHTVLACRNNTDYSVESHKGAKVRAVCLAPDNHAQIEQVVVENYLTVLPEYDPKIHEVERRDNGGLPCTLVLYDKTKLSGDAVLSPGYYDYCFDYTGQDFLRQAAPPVEEAYVDLPTAIQAFTSDIALFVTNKDVYRNRED